MSVYTNWGKLKNVCNLVNSIVPMSLTWFWYYTYSYKISLLGKLEEGFARLCVLFLQLLVSI